MNKSKTETNHFDIVTSVNYQIDDLEYDSKKPTLKNFYNFAKSLVHYTNKNNKYVEYPTRWKSLNDQQKREILKRLNNEYGDNSMKWFNISRYIRNRFKLDNSEIERIKRINLGIYKSTRR